MTKEEFITERTRIISEMLDNPDKYGLYPTTRCFTELDLLYDKIILSLKSQLSEAGEEKRNKLIKAYSDLVIEIDKHKGTTIKEVKLRNKIANLKLEIR